MWVVTPTILHQHSTFRQLELPSIPSSKHLLSFPAGLQFTGLDSRYLSGSEQTALSELSTHLHLEGETPEATAKILTPQQRPPAPMKVRWNWKTAISSTSRGQHNTEKVTDRQAPLPPATVSKIPVPTLPFSSPPLLPTIVYNLEMSTQLARLKHPIPTTMDWSSCGDHWLSSLPERQSKLTHPPAAVLE